MDDDLRDEPRSRREPHTRLVALVLVGVLILTMGPFLAALLF